jgi:hypothetical protein
MLQPAPTVLVGVDGSKTATDARACHDLCDAHNAGNPVLATRSSNL